MIERRKESRFRLSVPVKVSGIDDHDEPFVIELMATKLAAAERCRPGWTSSFGAETCRSWTIRDAERTFGSSGS